MSFWSLTARCSHAHRISRDSLWAILPSHTDLGVHVPFLNGHSDIGVSRPANHGWRWSGVHRGRRQSAARTPLTHARNRQRPRPAIAAGTSPV